MNYTVEVVGQTDVGQKRTHNEDSYSIERAQNLFVVADGMGGHACGEVASQMAVKTLTDFYEETANDQNKTWPFKMNKSLSYQENRMLVGVQSSNKNIYQHASSDIKLKGMGTTLVSLLLHEDFAYIGHVGDSRVYRIRNHSIQQLTEDHSLLNDYMKIKKLTEDEIKNFPHKNVIVRALGMKGSVMVDTIKESVEKEDVFLLCSDGLTGHLEDPDLLKLIEEASTLEEAAQNLIDLANARGGSDNITVVLAKIL